MGNIASREVYRKKLTEYFLADKNKLDADSLHRLHKNPLRILDSKDPTLKSLIENAPKLLDHLDSDAIQHFEKLQEYLTHANIAFEINPHLVRGLDYYTKTVFEWVTDQLGAQGTVCGGGRYDHLVEQLGGKPTPAIGFSFGMERTILLMQQATKKNKVINELHAYVITDNEEAFIHGLKLTHYLRSKVSGLHIMLHSGGGTLKNQFKKADKSGAQKSVIIF